MNKYGIIGESEAIKEVIAMIDQVSPSDISVLITGDSGTGKELVAKAIHQNSLRKSKPYIIVNCGAIPAGTIESELFGHKKGSFTGAIENRKGYFEAADGGSIFLDEIGETPLATQVKLLRTLEQGEIVPVGENKAKNVNVRVIAATNRDLTKEVKNENFRKDLYYRLKTINIHIPPLSERREDIPLFIDHFMTRFCDQNRMPYKPLSPKAISLLQDRHYNGNIRELKNLIESLIVLEKDKIIRPETVLQHSRSEGLEIENSPTFDTRFPVKIHNKNVDQVERELILRQLFMLRQDVEDIKAMLKQDILPKVKSPQINDISNVLNEMRHAYVDDHPEAIEIGIEKSLADIEKETIAKTLEKYFGSKRKTAKALGISERTLYRKLNEYNI
ncbi:MAG: sigma-54-dependent Fis family transcriptional regulator [Candidatus Marinimicrobia bacterium]|nr:sigma-54-dependent Fis family transcriptional regulator [Candidatus Neomarinimicrobiota bacterium]